MKIKQTSLLLYAMLNMFSIQLLAQKNNYSELITKKANLVEKKVIAWRHNIHQNPELGNREFRTAELVAKHLQSLGIEVKKKWVLQV